MEMDKDPEVAKLSVYSSAGEFKGEPDQLFINVDIVLCVYCTAKGVISDSSNFDLYEKASKNLKRGFHISLESQLQVEFFQKIINDFIQRNPSRTFFVASFMRVII